MINGAFLKEVKEKRENRKGRDITLNPFGVLSAAAPLPRGIPSCLRIVHAIPISSLVFPKRHRRRRFAANDVNGNPRLWPIFQCVSYDRQDRWGMGKEKRHGYSDYRVKRMGEQLSIRLQLPSTCRYGIIS